MAQVTALVSGTRDASTPPLLTTKLYLPPARHNLVARPRLTRRLNEGLSRKVTLISAPAGSGKTTLLSEWIPHSPHCVTWVSLDEGDNDPTRFWSYFIGGLQRLNPTLGENALALFQSPQPPPFEVCLTTLLNEIASFPDPFALVLDDYHVIQNRAIHAGITFLLDHMPPQLHLIITTRADPPLLLSRLRSREQLTELRTADLRFTSSEAADFFNQVMGLRLSAEDIAALETHTEGWVAGLQLAALSMQGRGDLSQFIAAFTGSHRYILDYLTDEVLERRPKGTETFLLQTSILNRLCGRLCDAVTGGSEGQATLERLEQANLFIVPLDDERQWYRYHHLFAEVLQARLRQSQPELLADLHRRASEWYEAHQAIAEAVQHALAAGDVGRAARLIEQERWVLLGRSEINTLHAWLDQLPVDTVRTHPRLSLAHAWIFSLLEQVEAIEPRLQDAEAALAGAPPAETPEQTAQSEALWGEIATLRAEIALSRSDIAEAIEWCRRALTLLPADNPLLRGVATLFLGHAQRRGGQMVEAELVYRQASALGLETDNLLLALHALANLSLVQMTRGHLNEAAGTSQQILQITVDRRRQAWPVTGLAYQGLGRLHYEWNELDTAADHLRRGIELGQRGGLTGLEINSRQTLAATLQAQNDSDGADEMLRQIAALTEQRHHPVYAANAAGWAARLRLRQGRLDAAGLWAENCGLTLADLDLSYTNEPEYLTLARVFIAQGQAQAVPQLLDRLQQIAAADQRTGSLIEILLLCALALQSLGDQAGARTALEQALTMAEPEGYIRLFVDEGEPMAALLRQAQAHGIVPHYAGKLLASFEAGAPGRRPRSDDLGPVAGGAAMISPLLIEPLTERELELLRLVSEGHSNQEIAQTLFLAIGTVKKHLNNIFGKLDVSSRTQAVARARELNLL